MLQIQHFLEALKLWRQTANPKITSYTSLLLQLATDIGCSWTDGKELPAEADDYLRMIDEQVYYLATDCQVSEELLTAGLIEMTERYIHRPLTEKEADIVYLKKMLAEVDEVDTILQKLALLKDAEFDRQVAYELACWREIIQEKAKGRLLL